MLGLGIGTSVMYLGVSSVSITCVRVENVFPVLLYRSLSPTAPLSFAIINFLKLWVRNNRNRQKPNPLYFLSNDICLHQELCLRLAGIISLHELQVCL